MSQGEPSRQELTPAGALLVTAVGLGVLLWAVFAFGVVGESEGCDPDTLNETGCMGPVGPYATIWGHQLAAQELHGYMSVALGGVFFGGLTWRHRRGTHATGVWGRGAASVLAAAVAFLVLTRFVPLIVVY